MTELFKGQANQSRLENATWNVRKIEAAPEQMTALADEYRAVAGAIRRDAMLSREGIEERIEAHRRRYGEALDAVSQSVETARSRADQYLATVLMEDEPADVHEATLRELQLQQGWSRAHSLLASGLAPAEVVDRLKRDLPALRALERELPAWLAAELNKPSEGRRSAFDRSASPDETVEELMRVVEDALIAVLPERVGQARQLKRRLHAASASAKSRRQMADLELAERGGIGPDRVRWAFERSELQREAKPRKTAAA